MSGKNKQKRLARSPKALRDARQELQRLVSLDQLVDDGLRNWYYKWSKSVDPRDLDDDIHLVDALEAKGRRADPIRSLTVNNNDNRALTVGDHSGPIIFGDHNQFRDINVYREFVNQSTETPKSVRQVLCESRQALEDSQLEAALRDVVFRDHDILTQEISKGAQMNKALVKNRWESMVTLIQTSAAASELISKFNAWWPAVGDWISGS